MTTLVPRMAALTLRRLLPAVLFAAAATLTVGAGNDSAIASAAPKEWDIQKYDACMARQNALYMAGEITTAGWIYVSNFCCESSGGVVNGNDCSAPPAVAASSAPTAPPSEAANPDVPAGAAPSTPKPGPKAPTPKTSFTLAPSAPAG